MDRASKHVGAYRGAASTAGRARSLLREILGPGRAKLADLQGAIERLEDMMCRYCLRKDSSGSIATIPEDIRMAALESLCPEDLEKHIQMSSARLETYDKMGVEVIM